jgi:hypothetical protein
MWVCVGVCLAGGGFCVGRGWLFTGWQGVGAQVVAVDAGLYPSERTGERSRWGCTTCQQACTVFG